MIRSGVIQSGSNQPKNGGAPRVLLIGRRFWPQTSNDRAGHLFQLACALKRQGADVEVLTPRYASSWPTEFSIREILVHRPVMAPKRDWSIGRYTRSTTAWLRHHAPDYDVMLCDSIREESLAAVEASRSSKCPVILQSSGWGAFSDPEWWTTSRAALRCGTIGMMADAVIAKSAGCERGLLTEGYDSKKIVRIDPGFTAGPLRTAEATRRARQALGSANGDLATDQNSTVLICPSNMTRQGNVTLLVKATRHLVAKYPDLRLWFLGDGPHRDWIYDTLRSDGVRASIAMPGSFCDIEDILTAADLYFQPDDDGLEFWMPSAIAAELPIVAIDSESTRQLIGTSNSNGDDGCPQQWIEWCSPGANGEVTAKLVRIAVRNVLDDFDSAIERAGKMRRYALRTRSQVDSVDAYLKLIRKIAGNRTPGRHKQSIEAAT